MDTKITLSFNEEVISRAKKFADSHDISLSRLTEFLYRRITSGHYQSLEELPVTEWIHKLAEGETEYHTKSRPRKALKNEYFKSRK